MSDTICCECPTVKFVVTDDRAVIPSQGTPQSVGYDLTAIEVDKIVGNVVYYRTGLKVIPPEGYYIQIVPRSSISKTGFVLANSVGTIDPDYTGELLIALANIDRGKPPLECPFVKTQLLLKKAEYFNVKVVAETDLPDTERGVGGFGSTDANHTA